MNEYAFLMHCEVDTNVVDYRAQPFRFEFTLDGKKRVYIADCARLLANSHFEVVEIKNDRRALRDPDYALKLERVSDLCTELGWAFRVVLKQQIINPPQRHANIDQIQSNRHTKFNDLHEYLVLSALERASGTTSLGALADALGGPPEGMAIAQAMMVRRLIDIDLGKPLAADSTVCAVSDAALAPLQEGAQ
jgi:hypothetical protein